MVYKFHQHQHSVALCCKHLWIEFNRPSQCAEHNSIHPLFTEHLLCSKPWGSSMNLRSSSSEWASTWHIWQWVRVWCLIKHVRTKVQREETTFPRSQSKGVTEVQPRIADPSPGWGDYLKHGTAQEKEVWSEWSVISIGLLAQGIWLALGVPLRTARGFWSSLW